MIRQKFFKSILALAFAPVLAIAVLGGCSQPEPEPEPLPEPVVVAPIAEPEPEPVFLPLTGEEVEDTDPRLQLRPLSVKIENTPASRPALGITKADVVYETITEGGITRFNAIFHSDVPESVGSVRSARNSDITIVPEYDAIFVFSGTNSLVWADLATAELAYMEESTAGKALHRISHKPAPHNLYLDTALAFDRAVERGYWLNTYWPNALAFGEYDISGLGDADDAAEVFVVFGGSTWDVTWKYDEATGAYLRFIGDVAQCDEEDSLKQINAANVVLLDVTYVPAQLFEGKGQTYNLDFTGSGSAVVFRDGVRIDCTWSTDGTHPPVFEDAYGNTVFLKPGKTWFEVPTDISKTVVTTGHPEIDDPTAVEDASVETSEEEYLAADAADVSE